MSAAASEKEEDVVSGHGESSEERAKESGLCGLVKEVELVTASDVWDSQRCSGGDGSQKARYRDIPWYFPSFVATKGSVDMVPS